MNPETPPNAAVSPPLPYPDEQPTGESIKATGPRSAYAINLVKQTLRDAVFMVAVNLVLLVVLTQAHLNILLPGTENVAALSKVRAISPALLLAAAIIIAPVLEESLFRGLPFLLNRWAERRQLISDQARPFVFWLLGGSAAVLFALAHADRGPAFHLPLAQLLMGLLSWHIINERGLRYSMLFHAAYNFMLTSFFLFSKP